MAQIDRSEIDGTGKEVTGAVVRGSKVLVTSGDTGLHREVLTNRDGRPGDRRCWLPGIGTNREPQFAARLNF
jgi:hypothetical protein